MKTRIIFILIASLLLINNKLNAQFSEIWSANANGMFVGCENMDTDPQKEIVYFSGNSFFIVDGLTGNIDWSSPSWYYISKDLTSSSSYQPYPDNNHYPYYNPKLIDINNDGIFELLFWGRKVSGDTDKLHLFSFLTTLSVNTVESKTNSIVEQNYPNPFKEFTTIKIKVDSRKMALVKTFDSNGKEMETILNEELIPGEYEVNINGSNYKPGIYFYQVILGNNIGSKKMIRL